MCQRRSCSSQANRNLMIYDRDPRSHPKTPTGNLLAATHPHGNSSRPIGRAVLKRHLAKFLSQIGHPFTCAQKSDTVSAGNKGPLLWVLYGRHDMIHLDDLAEIAEAL